MAAVEGRSDGFAQMDLVMSNPVPDEEKLARRSSLGSLHSFATRSHRSHSPQRSMSSQTSHSPQRTWSPQASTRSRHTTQDASRMAALEGRSDGFAQMERVMSTQS